MTMMGAAADLQQVYREIISRNPEHDFEPTLDRVVAVLDLLGNPQHAYKVVHVTGTNGKTSTSRMTERLVREYGLRTGLFTSPHLTSITERICVDGQPLSDDRFVEVYHDVLPYIEMVDSQSVAGGGPRLSFFEVLAVMAFAAFADAPVDVAVIEVGLGGTWDATNVVSPAVAVITPIGLDHSRWLGDTLAEVAQNKAGIIKAGATVVCAQQPAAAQGEILAAAAQADTHLVTEGNDIAVLERIVAVGGQVLTLRGTGGIYTDVFVSLLGEHQGHNALLALVAVEGLVAGGGALAAGMVEAAFADASSPGRLEVVRSSPTVVVDAAHNPHGATALAAALEDSFAFRRVVGIVGVLADKDAEGLLGELEPVLSEVVITAPRSQRAMSITDLEAIAVDVFGADRVHSAETVLDAIEIAVTAAERDYDPAGTNGVVVTGSIMLVAEAQMLFGR